MAYSCCLTSTPGDHDAEPQGSSSQALLCGLPLPDAQADAAGAVRVMAAWERRLGQVVIGGLILLGLLYA
jgi:hypothetical protein